LIRTGSYYNHEPNAVSANIKTYEVSEESNETWTEGVIIFHNPNAIVPLDPDLFDERVAQCFFDMDENILRSIMPEIFPYNSMTQNLII